MCRVATGQHCRAVARYILKRVPFKGKSTNAAIEKACAGAGGAAAVQDEDADQEELAEVEEGQVG